MSNETLYATLNDLLIQLGRSLLQYVGESWPWTDANTEKEIAALEEMVQKQKQQTAELVRFLQEAEWPIDYGTYPTEYTDLHYVALDFLLNQLIRNQYALVDDAKRVLVVCEQEPAAKQLVAEIQAVQQTIAHDLQSLAESLQSKSTKAAEA